MYSDRSGGISGDVNIGFFSLDRATQTEESELQTLKVMTENIQQLLKVGEFEKLCTPWQSPFVRESMHGS